MCGIAVAAGFDRETVDAALSAMNTQMVRRGPDDVGVAVVADGHAVVGLGSRRLAIIDRSPAGHQPMHDPARGTTIVYNGMLYNFRDLRERLRAEGESFVSGCDTEVVLKAYGRYGRDCVRWLRGMFAFAIWDPRCRNLFLARDRLGIKPLYYALDGGSLVVASSVKAILATGLVPARLSPGGIASYLSFGAPAEPLTAIDGIRVLPAGHVATFDDGHLDVRRYWEPTDPGPERSTRGVEEELRSLLADAVETHLVSDAPLGVFLSGGADSTIVTALATARAADVRSLSVVFDDPAYSEARYIDIAVERLGSSHRSITLRQTDLLGWLDHAFDGMDQPTFDGLNTYVVSRLAREEGLKVALSGLGADELFDGYGQLSKVRRLESVRRWPRPVRRIVGGAAGVATPGVPGEKLGAWLDFSYPGSAYELLRALFLPADVERLLRADPPDLGLGGRPGADPGHAVAVAELAGYMRNVLLRDTDAMAMANSLEVRVPFLDHPLVEYVLGLPPSARAGGKRVLLAAMRDLVPHEILGRRKQGFALPLARWMRDELRTEVADRIEHPPPAVDDVLDSRVAASVWRRFEADGHGWLRPWALYVLSRWVDSLPSGAEAPVGVRSIEGGTR